MRNYQGAEMPTFIQAMYGTVIGVVFYQFTFSGDNKIEISNLCDYTIDYERLFVFLLFFLTLLITAHDWYSYHKSKRYDDSKSENYWLYLPQIFAIFFRKCSLQLRNQDFNIGMPLDFFARQAIS